LRLRQGFGRLIRTKTDRGVIVIADPRIITKGYGREFRESLPVVPETADSAASLVREAKAFLEGRATTPAAATPSRRQATAKPKSRATSDNGPTNADREAFIDYSDASDQEQSPFLD
jgi:hypothetical protein